MASRVDLLALSTELEHIWEMLKKVGTKANVRTYVGMVSKDVKIKR